MEEHKALKYRDYHDKLYMIIGTENFDDTHPYNHVCSAYSVYGNILNYNNNQLITLNCVFWGIMWNQTS